MNNDTHEEIPMPIEEVGPVKGSVTLKDTTARKFLLAAALINSGGKGIEHMRGFRHSGKIKQMSAQEIDASNETVRLAEEKRARKAWRKAQK